MDSAFTSKPTAGWNASRGRSTRKSSLKRSKSLHCAKSRQLENGPSRQLTQLERHATNVNQSNKDKNINGYYYANRRHHSTNDYMAEYDNENLAYGNSNDWQGWILNSSSHNLYYEFQNGKTNNGQRGSCSSGTSLMSLNDITTGRSYQEEVFADDATATQLSCKMSMLSVSKPETGRGVPGYKNNNYGMYVPEPNPFELSYENEDDNVWDDLAPEKIFDKKMSDSSINSAYKGSYSSSGSRSSSESSSGSKKVTHSPYRFYIIKQRNYPPMYLGNGANRRRIYRVLVLGYPSSGKSTLIEQLCEVLNETPEVKFNPANAQELNQTTNLLMHFLESDSFDKYLLQMPVTDYQPDAYLILFNVNNRDSFNGVKKTLVDLQRWDDLETKSVIIIANKSDLVRGRCVTRKEARELACANNCKYIETSCTISHNIDALLQGIGWQICLKEQKLQQLNNKDLEPGDGYKLKRKSSFFKRILRRTAINKSKSCDNLHVL